MAIKELSTGGLFTGFVQSMGKDVPRPIELAAERAGIKLEPGSVPRFRLDTENKYPGVAGFASATIVTENGVKTMYVQPESLIIHAEELLQRIKLPEDERQRKRVYDYCILQSIVHLTLQAVPGISEDERERIFEQFSEDNY